MQFWRLKPAGLVLTAVFVLATPLATLAGTEGPANTATLSSFWSPAVTRWEPILLHYAERWSLDPNLVAAVIWKESLGRASSRSPAGAVGLMGLMPFPWRPSAEELEDPWTNVHWGSRALAQTIADGGGDLYYSLAAYNGSWPKAGQANTRRYAAAVLDLYARSVAVQNGLQPDGNWVALLTVEGISGADTLTVFGPQRELTRYTRRPLDAGIPSVPADASPHATVIAFANGRGQECRVSMWLVSPEGEPLSATTPGEPSITASEIDEAPGLGLIDPVTRLR